MYIITNIRWIDHKLRRKLTPSHSEVRQMKSHAEFIQPCAVLGRTVSSVLTLRDRFERARQTLRARGMPSVGSANEFAQQESIGMAGFGDGAWHGQRFVVQPRGEQLA